MYFTNTSRLEVAGGETKKGRRKTFFPRYFENETSKNK